MNGTKYFEYVIGSDDWNEKLAASKFAKYPNFGKFETGHICLQDHGNLVSYRNIKIRPIAGAKAAAKTTTAPKASAPSVAATTPTSSAPKAPAPKTTAKAEVKTEPKPAAKTESKATVKAESKPVPAAAKPTVKVETPAAPAPTSTATTEAAEEPETPAAGTTRTITTSRPTIRSRVRRIIDRITP
jgi:hypothetical protein